MTLPVSAGSGLIDTWPPLDEDQHWPPRGLDRQFLRWLAAHDHGSRNEALDAHPGRR